MTAKKYLAVAFILAVSLVLAGCSNSQKTGEAQAGSNQQQGSGDSTNSRQTGDMGWTSGGDFSEASASDLAVGDKVAVMGEKNPDGSITAETIIIGAGDFPQLGRPMMPPTDGQGDSGGNNSNNSQQAPASAEQARPGGSFAMGGLGGGMSDAERTAFRAQMAANGGGFRGGRNGGGGNEANGSGQTVTHRKVSAGAARVAGEIIGKDDKALTLKLQDGGSSIVFVSDQTAVRKVAPPQNPPAAE